MTNAREMPIERKSVFGTFMRKKKSSDSQSATFSGEFSKSKSLSKPNALLEGQDNSNPVDKIFSAEHRLQVRREFKCKMILTVTISLLIMVIASEKIKQE